MVATVNLIPAKMKGGRNTRPIFIPSHVEPQMTQRAVKTRLGALDCKSVQFLARYRASTYIPKMIETNGTYVCDSRVILSEPIPHSFF